MTQNCPQEHMYTREICPKSVNENVRGVTNLSAPLRASFDTLKPSWTTTDEGTP